MDHGDRALILLLGAVLAIGLLSGPGSVSAQHPDDVKLDSYAEWKQGGMLIVDGQRVTADASTKWKGKFASIADGPIGDEGRGLGVRQPSGAVLAREIDVRPNGNALFEQEVRNGTNELE